MAEQITIDELMAELNRLGIPDANGDEGSTLRELRDQWGQSQEKTTAIVRRCIAAGLVTPGRAARVAIDGTSRPVPVYRFIKKPVISKSKTRTAAKRAK